MSEVVAADEVTPLDPIDEESTLADTPLKKIFAAAVKHEASDLIARSGLVPRLRIRGELKALSMEAPSHEDFEHWIEQGLSKRQWSHYATHGSIDLAMEIEASGSLRRFRVNVFRTKGQSSLAARLISDHILDFEELFLPSHCRQIAEVTQGLVLLCGITGSGKSTTIASMINHVNKIRPCHILTIEDPIEYVFKEDKAVVNQREIGIDVPTPQVHVNEGTKRLSRARMDSKRLRAKLVRRSQIVLQCMGRRKIYKQRRPSLSRAGSS